MIILDIIHTKFLEEFFFIIIQKLNKKLNLLIKMHNALIKIIIY